MKKAKSALVVAQKMSGSPINKDKTLWEAENVPEEHAAEWFEGESERWSAWSGQSLTNSMGVLSRWLHFFSLQRGTSQRIQSLFGQHMHLA